MSLIDKKNLNYLSTVEQFFLSLKDSGMALSAADYHLIQRWEDQGVLLDLLCRAIEKGVTDHSRRQPRNGTRRVSLSALQSFIEGEIGRAEG